MTTFSASLTTLTFLLPQSRDCSCYVSNRILAPPQLCLQEHAVFRALSHLGTSINLWSLTLRAPETGDFVGLILLYLTSPTGLPYFPEFDVDHRSTETFPSTNVVSP